MFLITLLSIPVLFLPAGGKRDAAILTWTEYLNKNSTEISSVSGRHILARTESDVKAAEFIYDGNNQKISVFYPPDADFDSFYPAVILIGNPDIEVTGEYGKAYCYTPQALGWAQVFAEEGFAAVTFESPRTPDKDLVKVAEWLRKKGKTCAVDSDRIGLFSTSTSCSYALKATRPEQGGIPYPSLLFSVLAYGSLMNLQGLDTNISYCIVSAEYDTAWTDQSSVNRFQEKMTQAGAEVVRLHHSTGNHGFEMSEHTEESEAVIREIIDFMKTRAGLQRSRSE